MQHRGRAAVGVASLSGGGISAVVSVDTYSGAQEFEIRVERDADGDWIVFIPWDELLTDREVTLENGSICVNGIVYLGAPEEGGEDSEPVADTEG